jgi:hypothetical protein
MPHLCMIWTRPDIGYAVNLLSRYLTRPSESLVKAGKKVISYLKHTLTMGLRFSRPDCPERIERNSIVTGYVDASDADCLITRRSTGGHVLFIGPGLTLWKVGRQPIVTLSTAESELLQIGMAVQDVKHLNDLLDGLGFPQIGSTLNEDNQDAMKIAESPCQRSRIKHLCRRYMFVREAIENKEVVLVYCSTDKNIADIFTKPLAYDSFVYLRNILLSYEGYTPE